VSIHRLRFDVVAIRCQKSGRCPVCGRSVTRSKRFEQTVNPWNRNADGTVKTVAEVRADVRREADAWLPDFTHATCVPPEAVAA
jgi:hypothetical protein